jgi:hypothetical protein
MITICLFRCDWYDTCHGWYTSLILIPYQNHEGLMFGIGNGGDDAIHATIASQLTFAHQVWTSNDGADARGSGNDQLSITTSVTSAN